MKRFLIGLICFSFLLTGCFGNAEKKKEVQKKEGFQLYETEEFLIRVPNEWEILTDVNFKSNIPKNTLSAFRNNIKNPLFTANVAVLKNKLPEEVSSNDYAKALYKKISDDLSGVKEILVESINTQEDRKENKTLFVYLEGRDSPDAEKKKFMEVSFVKRKNAYTAIGSFLATENEELTKKVETMVRSFQVK